MTDTQQSNQRRNSEKLRIRQQNLNKSLTATEHLLNDNIAERYNIIAIQEPYIDFARKARARRQWYPVYPKAHYIDNIGRTRSMILVNKRLASDAWASFDIGSPDATGIIISNENSNVLIFNLYCDQDSPDAIIKADKFLQEYKQKNNTNKNIKAIWLGDFNRHNPLWDDPKNNHLFARHNLDQAQILLDAIAKQQLYMALPKKIPTLRAMATGNYTRPDNVFVSLKLQGRIIECKTVPEDQPPKTDHLPIDTIIETRTNIITEKKKRDFKKVDWEKFRDSLNGKIREDIETTPIRNSADLNHRVETLNKTITNTIDEFVPVSTPSLHTKRWWSKELTALRQQMRSRARAAYRNKNHLDHPAHAQYKAAQNKYADAIDKAKKDKWHEFLSQIYEHTVWTAHKYASTTPTDGGKARIPDIAYKDSEGRTRYACTNEEKARTFCSTFFEMSSNTNPTQRREEEYLQPAFTFKAITDTQIMRAIRRISPYKAPGANGIPNVILKKCADILVLILGPIFRATFDLLTYPCEWKNSITLVIPKPARPCYTEPGAYRPIALLDTIAKILSACIAEDLTKLAELHDILPENHFGCRPGRASTDALHYTVPYIKNAWRRGEVVEALFLDIKAAFPSVLLEQLIHNMRKRGISKQYTDWIRNRVKGRSMQITFDDFTSCRVSLEQGIDQGCPLSGVLFQFYNAGILDITVKSQGEDSVAVVDNTTILVKGADLQETNEKLIEVMIRPNGIMDWAQEHNCTFAINKFGLIGFTRRREKDERGQAKMKPIQRPKLQLRDHTIEPKSSHKFLGIIMDQELRFKEQNMYALQKGTKWLEQYKRLASGTKGISAKYMKRYCYTVALPKMLYAADIFLVPETENSRGTKNFITMLGRVHRQALLHITGAMKTTATDILEAHADIPQFSILLKKKLGRDALRLACLPQTHPLAGEVQKAARRYVKRHRTPLHEVLHAFNIKPAAMEKITPIGKGPKWEPCHNMRIPKDKDEALREAELVVDDVQIYTDGSCIGGGVGAAAILYRNGIECDILRKHLGSEEHHTVYEAEIVGAIMGAHLASKTTAEDGVTIALENQAAITSSLIGKQTAGQHLVLALQDELKLITNRRRDTTCTLRWVPGHEGNVGNEKADKQAKIAAGGQSSAVKELPKMIRKQLPISKTAAKQTLMKSLENKQRETFISSRRAKKQRSIDLTSPSKAFTKYTKSLPRRAAALLI